MTDWMTAPCKYCARAVMQDGAHADECPQATGMFTVTDDEFPHGLICTDCHDPLPDGATYVRGPVSDNCPFDGFPEEANVFGLYCVGCAAIRAAVA